MKAHFAAGLLLALTGCTSMGITEQKTLKIKSIDSDEKLVVASLPSQLRNVYVWRTEAGDVICPEPFPDTAVSTSVKATAEALQSLSNSLNQAIELEKERTLNNARNESTGASTVASNSGSSGINHSSTSSGLNNSLNQTVKLGLEATNQIMNLGGRNDLVLLTRDMFFQNCLAAANKQNGEPGADGKPTSEAQVNMQRIIEITLEMVKADRLKAEVKVSEAKAVENSAAAEQAKAEKALEDAKSKNRNMLVKHYTKEYQNDLESCKMNAQGNNSEITICNNQYNEKMAKLVENF